ncbi:hypothetical protein HHI36_001622 [Cryptolaemus montrouzieri]|uniref:Uncharacterized protein n=1 Tax=Cryptolaemus montrouzieri TaxID=559131 RepID=A0ABD2P880_9CUCU
MPMFQRLGPHCNLLELSKLRKTRSCFIPRRCRTLRSWEVEREKQIRCPPANTSFVKPSFEHLEWKSWLRIIRNFCQPCPVSPRVSTTPNPQVHHSSVNINPLLDSKKNDNRPYICISIESEKISALLDSGSNVSILGAPSLYLLRLLNLSLRYDIAISLTTADGQLQNAMGYVELPISLGKLCKILKVLVVPTITHKLILGMDFINVFKLQLDFRRFSYNSSVLTTCVVNAIQTAETLSEPEKRQ